MPTYSTLQVVQPPKIEPVSSARLISHLRLDSSEDPELLKMYLSAARTWGEDYLGRTLIATQFLYTISETPSLGAYPFISLPFPITIYPLWYPWPNIMNLPMTLPRTPVISVDQVSYGLWGKPETVLSNADPNNPQYYFDVNTFRLRITSGAAPASKDHLSILFTAGYGTDRSSVPKNIQLGILFLAAYLYEHRGDDENSITTGMPIVAQRLMGTDRVVTFGG